MHHPRRIIRAIVSGLRLDAQDKSGLQALDDREWETALDIADRAHLTLALATRCGDAMPAWVRDRVEGNLASNRLRFERIQDLYRAIDAALGSRGIEFVVLKGFTQDLPPRPQGDIDILCKPEDAANAQQALIELGYEEVTRPGEFHSDHLPLLIRRTGWKWRGDYYDPEAPPSIEVHFRLWDDRTEHIAVDGLDDFWERRQRKTAHGLTFTQFDPVDQLAYAALHCLRHLLRGDLLLNHAYELALMLDRTTDNETFWSTWRERYGESFRGLQSIVFRMARRWFGGRTEADCQSAAGFQPAPQRAESWLEHFGAEPHGPSALTDKSEVWLHISLTASRADAFSVVRRKLFPTQKRRQLFHPHLRPSQITVTLKVERQVRHLAFVSRRLAHHARSLPASIAQGLTWWLRWRGLNSDFLRFLGAASLFNFGMTVFFLLYNLHLLKRGLHEDALGLVSGAMTIGSITGTIPAGFILGRFGLKSALLIAFGVGPAISVARALVTGSDLLVATAFLCGFAFSMYAVALTPAVAQFVSEKVRPLAFSLVCSLGIGIGIVGSAIGGMVPGWLGGYEPALLVACGVAGLGVIPVLRLRLARPSSVRENVYPRNPAITKYLAALGLWSLATGAMNPFFNVFFTMQLKVPVHTIGAIFSSSHLVQASAVLAAPLVFRRLGMPTGIMLMQMATGAALALLALEPPLVGAAILYISYMAFQFMSEPGMFTFLMDNVKEEERGGAAALNFLILFAGQALAAMISGMALRRFGYFAVLITAALLAMVAGLVFRLALSRRSPVLLERTAER